MQVALLEGRACREAVHQVKDGVDALQRPTDGRGVQEITLHYLHVVAPGATVEPFRVPRQAPDTVARGEEARHQTSADIAGGARDKDMLRMG
jgi:hypothetical protein